MSDFSKLKPGDRVIREITGGGLKMPYRDEVTVIGVRGGRDGYISLDGGGLHRLDGSCAVHVTRYTHRLIGIVDPKA